MQKYTQVKRETIEIPCRIIVAISGYFLERILEILTVCVHIYLNRRAELHQRKVKNLHVPKIEILNN